MILDKKGLLLDIEEKWQVFQSKSARQLVVVSCEGQMFYTWVTVL